MVVVDTSIWVQFFRARGSPEQREVARLLAQREVAMVGVVLAEVLQGARNRQQFVDLSIRLTELPYLAETQKTWAQVAELSYRLRQQGVGVAIVDLLIAALAMEHDCQVYTLDEHFQRIPGVKLYEAGASS